MKFTSPEASVLCADVWNGDRGAPGRRRPQPESRSQGAICLCRGEAAGRSVYTFLASRKKPYVRGGSRAA